MASVSDSHILITGLLPPDEIEREALAAIDAAADGESVAIGLVTFDGFTEIVARQGNLVADQVLRELARRLRDAVPAWDRIGHQARDEFIVVFRKLGSRLETLALVSRLRIAVNEPIKVGTTLYRPTLNLGLAHPPADGTTLAALLEVAEPAMLVMREQCREAARAEAAKRLASAREAVTQAQLAITAAERGVREADLALAEAKQDLLDAKASVVAATEHAKALGVATD